MLGKKPKKDEAAITGEFVSGGSQPSKTVFPKIDLSLLLLRFQTFLIYGFLACFLYLVIHQIWLTKQTNQTLINSHKEIQDIKDSTLQVAKDWIDEVNQEKMNNQNQIIYLKDSLNKKTKTKLVRIESISNATVAPNFKYKDSIVLNKIYKDTVIKNIHVINDTVVMTDTIRLKSVVEKKLKFKHVKKD